MKWFGLACLAAAGGLWAWAFSESVERPRPAPGIAGSYRLYRYEPPEEAKGTPNPFGDTSVNYFDFREDGVYTMLVFGGRRELIRREGFFRFDGSRLELEQVSENRVLTPQPPQAFQPEWKEDPEGKYLLLTHDPVRYQLYLRPGSR